MISIGANFKDEAQMSKNDDSTPPNQSQPSPEHEKIPAQTPEQPASSTAQHTLTSPVDGSGLDGLGGGRLP
jgi:biotin carboxyl carrier protein